MSLRLEARWIQKSRNLEHNLQPIILRPLMSTFLIIAARLQPVDELHEGIIEVLHGVCVVPHGDQLVLRPGDGGTESGELCVVRQEAFEVCETKAPVKFCCRIQGQ